MHNPQCRPRSMGPFAIALLSSLVTCPRLLSVRRVRLLRPLCLVVLRTDELQQVLLQVQAGRRPVRAVIPGLLRGGPLAHGGAGVGGGGHVDRGARALRARGAARARLRRGGAAAAGVGGAVRVLGPQPPPRQRRHLPAEIVSHN